MGWLWSSSAPTAAESQVDSQSAQSSQTQPPPSEPSTSAPAPRKLTRDELADSEFRSLLEELEADISVSSSKYNHVPQPLPPHTQNSSSSTANGKANSRLRPATSLEDQLLPKEMSCREAFDAAFYCQSLGGQFNHVYRFGGIRSCSENWSDFWFCMRSKSLPTSLSSISNDGLSVKEERIRQHYKMKNLKYKVGPSSEDVWASRDERLGWGEAFSAPVEQTQMSDEAWNVMERERRERRVREIEERP